MAILQKWNVSIEVDGKALEEINGRPENEEQSTAAASTTEATTKYIEVKSTAEFAIRIAAPKAYPLVGNAVVADLFIDGVCFAHKLFDKYNTHQGKYVLSAREKVVEGQEVGPSDGGAKLKPFQFSSLQGHTHTTADVSEETLAKIGTIEIKLVHFQKIRWSATKHGLARDTDKATPTSHCSVACLRELGLSHLMKLGAERSYKRSKPWAGERLGDVFANFTFKYRSCYALQDLGLIPRSPSPEPETEKPVEEWSVKQLRSFVRKFQAAVRRPDEIVASPDDDLKDDLEVLKDEVPKTEDVKGEPRAEQKPVIDATRGIKREIPDGAVVIDLDADVPPTNRGEGRPHKAVPPPGVHVIVIDEEEEPLFM